MIYSKDGRQLDFGGDKYELKKPYQLHDMERFYELTKEQEKFLTKIVEDETSIENLSKVYKRRISNILKILMYLKSDKRMLNIIREQYKTQHGV